MPTRLYFTSHPNALIELAPQGDLSDSSLKNDHDSEKPLY